MLIQIDKLVQLLESPVFTCRSRKLAFQSFADAFQIFDFSFSNQRNTPICINAFMEF